MVKLNIDIPESFFKGEERCGYYVSPEMKEVWAVELDLLNEVARICKKHLIRWFADGGTMLGAVRHGGFIPWDDDVDVRMLRADYEKFKLVAPQELRSPYFFQSEETDPSSLRCHIQIRNSETAGILKREVYGRYQFNQGIFLDIFPWDVIHDEEDKVIQQVKEMREQYDRLFLERRFAYEFCWNYNSNFFLRTYCILKAFWIRNYVVGKNNWMSDYRKIEEIMTRYQSKNYSKVGNLCLLQYKKNWHNLKEEYDDVIMMPFEMLQVPVPHLYEQALTDQFGNWKEFVVGSSIHGEVLFDTERSYKEVIKEMRKEGVDKWLLRNGYTK